MKLLNGTCAETDPEIWFPPQPNAKTGKAKLARLMCFDCVVYEDCLNDVAAGNLNEHGVKAGMGVKEQHEFIKLVS